MLFTKFSIIFIFRKSKIRPFIHQLHLLKSHSRFTQKKIYYIPKLMLLFIRTH